MFTSQRYFLCEIFTGAAATTHITLEVRHSTQIRRRSSSSHRFSPGVRKNWNFVNLFIFATIVRRVLVNKGEEEKVEGTHGLQMLDGSPLARLPTMPRFKIAKFSLIIKTVNHHHSQIIIHLPKLTLWSFLKNLDCESSSLMMFAVVELRFTEREVPWPGRQVRRGGTLPIVLIVPDKAF